MSIEEKPFHIYKSSAGSGKTYTLTKEYLKIALKHKGAFKQILGVTFTNKATEEMKSRIVAVLKEIADGSHPPIQKELMLSLEMSAAVIQKVASDTLSDILHQYGRFSIVTIDSFFHQVIRSFAREMGLQGSFSIDLNLTEVMEKVVDEMLMTVGNDDKKQLKRWLVKFAEERVENGDSWDIRREINNLAAQILTDDFKPYAKSVLELSKDQKFFDEVKKQIDQKRYAFENKIKSLCDKAIKIIESSGVSPFDFKGGKTQSPAMLFYKVAFTFLPSEAQIKKSGDRSAWIKAKDPNNALLESVLDSGLQDCYDAIIDTFINENISYQSSKEALKYFYTFGILSEINHQIQDYREANDVMLIADLPDFLHQIINDSETPYIYEKVGSLFQNYLIDEFQDTSSFQWENFKPLVKNAADQRSFGMVVGDVKQSIYRWRGGDWQLLQHQLKQDIGDYHVQEESLTTNWRSDYQIVDFNNLFFTSGLAVSRTYFGESIKQVIDTDHLEKITRRVEEVLSTYEDVKQNTPKDKDFNNGFVQVQFFSEEESDTSEKWKEQALRQTILEVEMAQMNGFELRDIAILTRSKPEGKAVADAFMQYKNTGEAKAAFKYDVVSSEALFLTTSHLVRFSISLIKWLNNEVNTIALAEWLFEYERYILKSEKTETAIFSSKEYWEKVVPESFVKQKDYLKTLPLFELVEHLIDIFRLNDQKEEFIYLQGFQDAILDYSKNERGDISSFLEWWEKVKDKKTIQISDDNNAIKIMTIHKSKGLEFPVVIVPFLSWDLDHSANNSNILWCAGGAVAPYHKLPVLPLSYSSKLANTYWAMEYYDEKLKAFLDSLNLLYVAFTRAVNSLIVFGKLPKPAKGASAPNLDAIGLKNIGDFVLSTVKELPNFDASSYTYTHGKWGRPSEAKKSEIIEFELARYHSHPWRQKANIQIKDALDSEKSVFSEATQAGIRIHDLISQVRYERDLTKITDSTDKEVIAALVNTPTIRDWFDEKWQVDTEVTMLLPNGDFKRIDRINRSETATIVIDFKTGKPRRKDHDQVREYLSLLQEMGHSNVSGQLIYLEDQSVEPVSL